MLKIIFVAHAQTTDNVAGIATGWADPDLTDEGQRAARHIGELLKDTPIDAAFSSDQIRARHTAELVLGGRPVKVTPDQRLRDVNFGDLTGRPRAEVRPIKVNYIDQPYPNGESYSDVLARYREFLTELARSQPDKTVLLCASGVFPLEAIINHRPLAELLPDKVPTYRVFEIK